MAAVIGLIIGYVLGTRAGDKGQEELRDSWRTITSSQSFRDMLGGLFALIGEFIHQGRGALAQRLQTPEIEARSRELEKAA
jgi:membrane protein DedA with SNARE-associated domain